MRSRLVVLLPVVLVSSLVAASCGGSDGTDTGAGGAAGGTTGAGGGSAGSGASAGKGAAGKAAAGGVGAGGKSAMGGSSGAGGGTSGSGGQSNAGASGSAGASGGSAGNTAGAGTAGSAGTSGSSGASGASGSSAGGASGAAGASGGCPAGCNDPKLPKCDPSSGTCVACLPGDKQPAGVCDKGVCASTAATCEGGAWACHGPGYQAVETTCDGFDNDCNGLVDEGCAVCTVPVAAIQAQMNSIWDIDFDFDCNAYLTSLISGPDFAKVVPANGGAVKTYFGNKNQNMGYGLVDPDPKSARVVVSYACGNASCLAQNGLTLLYTCAKADPGCGCAAETNCPGFLDAPFLEAPIAVNTSVQFNGFEVGTPTGLAVGAGRAYFVGNYRPTKCDATPACTQCDPANPGVTCSSTKLPCCSAPPALGRLVQFTLPMPGIEPSFRVEAVFAGEEVLGLASGRDGSVYVGTRASATKGNLYRVFLGGAAPQLLATFGGPVFSVTQLRSNGDLYLEVRSTPKIVRLDEKGNPLPLTGNVAANPMQDGILQAGPDGKIYRVIGKVDAQSTLEVYTP